MPGEPIPTRDPAEPSKEDIAPPARIGLGWDRHRLEAGADRPLILGGVRLEHDRGPVGHSDGDAMLHAITDALLGAAGEPDIGQLFPDTDSANAGRDSADFLTEASRRIRQAGLTPVNIDVVVILERPKIGLHKERMRQNIARLLEILSPDVNVKGKTGEGVDAVGQGYAVEARAVALLVCQTSSPAAEVAHASRVGTAETAAPRLDASLWQRAASFAARAHQGHFRRDGQTPYFAHPVRVALIVRNVFSCDDAVCLAAALLHDVIEDTDADYDEIAERFGAEVADCGAALSKDMRLPEPRREPAYDQALARAGWRAQLVKLADAYDNLCDLSDPADRRRVLDRCRRAVRIARANAQPPQSLIRAAEALEALMREHADRPNE